MDEKNLREMFRRRKLYDTIFEAIRNIITSPAFTGMSAVEVGKEMIEYARESGDDLEEFLSWFAE